MAPRNPKSAKGTSKRTKHTKTEAPVPVKKQPRAQPDDEETTDIAEMTVQEKCNLIAELSEAVLEDPSTAFTVRKDEGTPSRIQQLLTLATVSTNGGDDYIARLAIMSLLALFQDILPSYRIRLPTAAEMAVKINKETRAMWDYERSLLTHYQLYLKMLERTWEQRNNDTNNPLPVTAILSLCELLKSAFHFNFRSNILASVVRQMNNRQCEEVGDACCQAIEHVFTHDAQGDVALEAARLVSKLTKDRNFRVRAAVLRTFLKLPLRVHVDEAEAAKLAAAANAKKRKRNREEAEIEAELREGSSSVDKIMLARSQSDTLQTVTLTYFRVLKSEDLTTEHIAELLPPALEGLAKFAHLINIETVVDLLAVLKNLLKKVDELPLDASLNCVLTAFQTLQGPGSEMKIDQKEYITPLYSQLPRLYTESTGRKHTELALKCLTAAFIKRREYSTLRIAAFVKQLCTVSMHAPAHTSAPLLAFVRQMIHRYPSVHQMLENEQDVITSGKYNPDVEDPEHSNPMATSAWELATLRFHIHPAVADHASGAASQKLLQLPVEAPERVRAEMSRDSDELYIVTRLVNKRHPLATRMQDTNNNKKRQNVRFITPRRTANGHLS